MSGRTAAIVLAAGSGSRMGTTQKKQYLLLREKPLLYYALQAFEESFIQEVLLVTSQNEISYCEKEIVARYGFHKVRQVVAGGKERCHSVANGLLALTNLWKEPREEDTVYIHDGARPFVTQSLLEKLQSEVTLTGAAVAAVQAKNTIKRADSDGYAKETLPRAQLYEMQTPQVFSVPLIVSCYEQMIKKQAADTSCPIPTDDAQLVEWFTKTKIKLTPSTYSNIKITTPEDLLFADAILSSMKSSLSVS